jgi:hypothetical protein
MSNAHTQENIERFLWWAHPRLEKMRSHPVWAPVFAHLCNALGMQSESVFPQIFAAAGAPPAAQARTERTAAGKGICGSTLELDFSQAGVVAPPDGLTGETPIASDFFQSPS